MIEQTVNKMDDSTNIIKKIFLKFALDYLDLGFRELHYN